MNRTPAVVVSFLMLWIPSGLLAKAATSRIIIRGSDLNTPIEISDPKVLKDFRVWAGPGTSSNEGQSLIIDWSQGMIGAPPKDLQLYSVSFYVQLAPEKYGLVYKVLYAYDTSRGKGYVYLPGEADDGYGLNVRSIVHFVEGHWFHAWKVWDSVARPLLQDAKETSSRNLDFGCNFRHKSTSCGSGDTWRFRATCST